MKAFKNCNIYVNNNEIKKMSLVFGSVVESFDEPKSDFLELDDNLTVIPGLIDKHTHGVNGNKFAGATQEQMVEMVKDKAKEGVTSMVATFAALTVEQIKKYTKDVVEFMTTNELGSSIVGLHYEGPFLAPDYRGGNPEANIIRGTLETFKEMVQDNLKYVKQITLDPKFCDVELLDYLNENNITICVGHAGNTCKEIQEAMKHGLSCVTHSYASMNQISGQEIGVMGAGLLEDDLYCEVIADNFSVSKEAMQLLYKVKGNDKICVVTDSSATSHLPDGVHQVGAKTIHIENKTAKTPEGKYAGSVLWVNDGVRNLKNNLNIDLGTAVNFAAKNNAKNLNLSNIGEIALNKDADFTVVNENLEVVLTIAKGKVIYKK
ncbi:MAG: N-acetylglucosamine-6-phosphate deacetylase [bacterium]